MARAQTIRHVGSRAWPVFFFFSFFGGRGVVFPLNMSQREPARLCCLAASGQTLVMCLARLSGVLTCGDAAVKYSSLRLMCFEQQPE